MIAGGQYAANFEWMNSQNYVALCNNVYQQGYDYNRSPTTSGSSNTSLNDSRIDPKLSPKYREKRKKNNEAAKKSRATRKQRETETIHENQKLKNEIVRLNAQSLEMTNQLRASEKTIQGLMAEHEVLVSRLRVYEPYPIKPLGEINRNLQQNQEGQKYQMLN